MANHSYPVEVQSDFLEKITRAKPVLAIAELIRNSTAARESARLIEYLCDCLATRAPELNDDLSEAELRLYDHAANRRKGAAGLL